MSNYESLLDRPWKDVPLDVILPDGPYHLRALRGHVFDGDEDKGTAPQALIVFQPKAPLEGVDEDEIAELGPDFDISMNRVEYMEFLEDNSKFNKVKGVLAKLGVLDENKSLRDNIKDAARAEVIGILGSRTYQDKKSGENVTKNTIKGFTAFE